MIRNGLQETLLIEKYMMQNYVDGRREENDLLMCLFTYIYKTCKISLEGYKKHISPAASEGENCRGKGMELESFHYPLICYRLNSKSCESINYSTNTYNTST